MDHSLRRGRVARRLDELGIEALLVTRLPNVRYLTGFTGSNGQLLVAAEWAVLLTDGRYTEQARREVPDLECVTSSDGLVGSLGEATAAAGVRRVGFERAGVTYKTFEEISEKTDLDLVPVGEEVERARWTKEPEELAIIRRAQAVTDEAFGQILGTLAAGVSEREVALELELAMRRAGADGPAFEPVVAFGENAAEPHHAPAERGLRRGDVVKMDFGAAVDGYRSDMTRTVAYGDIPARLREVYEVVRESQQAGVDAVRAGITGEEGDGASRRVIEAAGCGELFTHSTGHGVGLEIHEGPTLRRGSEDLLPAGAVVTVEPGIYVPGLGGVRIEDMVSVSEDGCAVIATSTKELVVL